MAMNDWMQYLFGPLNASSCNYFLMLSVIGFVLMSMTLVSEVMYVLKHNQRLSLRMVGTAGALVFNLFLAYFVNRLLYNMCQRTIV